MSLFLEILRCVLCCFEDNREHDNEPLYRNTSRERVNESQSNAHAKYSLIYDSGPSTSAYTGSTYAKSAYNVVASSNGSAKYGYISSYSQPTSSSRLPNPSSEKLVSPSNPTPLRPKPTTSSNQSQSPFVPKVSSSSPTLSPSSSKPSPQGPSQSLNRPPKNPISYSIPSPSFPTPAASSSRPVNVSPKAPSSSSEPCPSASKAPPFFKPTPAPASSHFTGQNKKANYAFVHKDITTIYAIPKDIQDLLKKDKVPEVLKRPLSLSTYKDYFAALLYAEDYYIEKWSKFTLEGITLKLQVLAVHKQLGSNEKDDIKFVEFQIEASLERRPFLLSRDFVFVRPSGCKTEPFQASPPNSQLHITENSMFIQKSTTVLVEFGEDFHAQHFSSRKYDVSFSFNRVCLKRAHQAIEAAADPSFESFIFPSGGFRKSIAPASPNLCYTNKLDPEQKSVVCQIITIRGLPPYLIEGPLCISKVPKKQLSRTGVVVQQAVLEIFCSSREHRILICAPINNTCDMLMTYLKEIPKSEMFRANAAFREIDGVPTDILASSLYEGECFACPPLQELRKFKVIMSTYVSSFRLHNEGISAGHFSHIFMVDASSATEPEAMVVLANLANEKTTVIITGAPRNRSGWVRSNIARNNGLMKSYFERLRERNPYITLNPSFVTKLAD